MFPFELSMFNVALVAAITILVILYLLVLIKLNPADPQVGTAQKVSEARKTGQSVPTPAPPIDRPIPPAASTTGDADAVSSASGPTSTSEAQAPVRGNANRVQGCPHYYGYLRNHPKNTPIPNMCLTCHKMMDCLMTVDNIVVKS